MNKISILLLLVLGCFILEKHAHGFEQLSPPAYENAESSQMESYVLPVIKPEISLTAGYRPVHLNGSTDAAEYEYFHDSFLLGGELRRVSLNQRLHLDLEIINKKDYYGDISYAYKDLILFRGVNTTFFHNLDNIALAPFSSSFPVTIEDAGEAYGVKVGISSLFLRLKAPDFPAHLYFEGNVVDTDGEAQQRFLGGSGFFNDRRRISEKRDIDLQTGIYKVGTKSHLGPVEVDFSHSEKRLDVDGDRVLSDPYTSSSFRTAGSYYHNLIPELESSKNTLRIHTSSTGGLAASALLSKTDKENRDSGATADYLFAAGEVTWMPLAQLTLFVKYRHQEREVENPDTVTVQNMTDFSTYSYAVRNSISSISDAVSGTVRYRPFRGVMLKADYKYEDIRRNDEEDWHVIPDSTQRHKFLLSGDVRVMSGLKLKAKYTHRDINNPATNAEPDRSDEGLLTLSWTPIPGVNAYISYNIKEEKRESLDFSDGTSVITAENRKVNNDGVIGTISCALLSNLSATASYAYMHNKVRQDIILSSTNPEYFDYLVPYKTTARNYAFALNYSPKSFIILNGGISHTVSRGSFYPSAEALAQPESIAAFSELEIRETTYSARGEYQFKGGVSAGIQYRYTTFKDLEDNPYDDVNDGRASIILLTVSKKW